MVYWWRVESLSPGRVSIHCHAYVDSGSFTRLGARFPSPAPGTMIQVSRRFRRSAHPLP